ncbi:type IV secretion system DNA-binding domain-containing protein [Colwellia sp. D2M02]|uniref:type IV secretion system DNA-binding domain-containing protein n=1 Tax=Colwellia sp. D2M02 TaxID=2841562 RepID=UPI001C09F922|nr:type IV secretion system DNA-binding domain-containing protein [Colwellia sp. D2M02]MBU2894221.1 type IV secretion system DNA-binding domain-containing protein [Colwellia sp. D2M02]
MRELKNTYQLWYEIVFVTILLTLVASYFLIKYTWEINNDWGPFEGHLKVIPLIIRDTKDFKLTSFYQYKDYLLENNYAIKWLLQILIPFSICLLFSLFIAFKLFWIKGGIDKAIHISGGRLLKDKFAIKHAKRILEKEYKNSLTIGLNLHPQITISEKQELGNILVTGAQGSGKSTVIKPLVNAISNTEDLMLIYDAKQEYTQLFLKQNNLLLSPTDTRSLCWDIAADVSSPEVAYEIASCFISQSGKEPIWANGARLLLTGCMVSLNHIKPEWSWDDLKDILDKPTDELKSLFDRYYPKASKLIAENSKTTDSFIMELTTQLSWLDSVAKVWTKDSKYKFSITHWIEGHYNFKSLIIANDPKYSSISAPLCSAVLSIVVREVLSLPDDNKRKFWLVLDELADLPKTQALDKWLSLGRSKGARTIAGTQNISQIQAIYGDKITETLTSLFSNIITLKIGSSAETAKKVADNLGKRLVKRANISFDKEGKRSTSYQQSEEYIVRPEQLMQLPSPNKNGITGYLSVSGWNAVYELIWPYHELEVIAEARVPVELGDHSFETLARGSRGRKRKC